MSYPQLLISIGAEGGSIALYGDITDASQPRFKLMVVDQTPTFLTGDDAGLEIRRDSGWLLSWADAMTALDRYPWVQLHVLHVDPAVAASVWMSVEHYIARSNQPVRDISLDRWRAACGKTQDMKG